LVFDRDDVKLKRGYLDCRYMGESETRNEMVDCEMVDDEMRE